MMIAVSPETNLKIDPFSFKKIFLDHTHSEDYSRAIKFSKSLNSNLDTLKIFRYFKKMGLS